jgi:hypothetical protein
VSVRFTYFRQCLLGTGLANTPGMTQKFYFLLVMLACLAGVEKARSNNIILDWNASASPNVAGYNVYYGTTSGIYSYKVDAGNITSVTISNLTSGVTYYFAATAYDANGDESQFSSEVSFTAAGALTMTIGASPGSPQTIQFPATPGHWYEIQATTDLQNWSSIWQSDVATSNTMTQFTDPDAGLFSSRFYRLVMH